MKIPKYDKNQNVIETAFCAAEEVFTHPECHVHFHLYSIEYSQMHTHDFWEFFVVLSGTITHRLCGRAEKLGENDLVLIRPFDQHGFVDPGGDKYQQLDVMITAEDFRRLADEIDPRLYERIVSLPEPLHIRLNQFVTNELMNTVHLIQLLPENDLSTYASLIRTMFLSVLTLAYKKLCHLVSGYPEWLNDFLDDIRKPQNMSLRVEELVGLTNFSYPQLSRLFKRYVGKSLSAYLIELKLAYAARLLTTTDLTILDVSGMLGYNSLSHFNRIFKAYFGTTPSDYRRV